MSTKIAEKFEDTMKVGYLNMLILMILEKNPSYGYKIGKEIEKKTLGLWDIPSSTLYTVLKNMTDKKLISFFEEQVDGRNRKVYEITNKGHSTLNIMLEKKSIIEHSFETLKEAILGEETNNSHKKLYKLGPLNLIFAKLDEKTEKEQIDFLELRRVIITRDIERHRKLIKRIDERISILKEKIRNEEKNLND
jgi:PadR family transcriptional regulator PadR